MFGEGGVLCRIPSIWLCSSSTRWGAWIWPGNIRISSLIHSHRHWGETSWVLTSVLQMSQHFTIQQQHAPLVVTERRHLPVSIQLSHTCACFLMYCPVQHCQFLSQRRTVNWPKLLAPPPLCVRFPVWHIPLYAMFSPNVYLWLEGGTKCGVNRPWRKSCFLLMVLGKKKTTNIN